MSRSTFSGPIKSGTNRYAPYYNAGTTQLIQSTAFNFTAAGTTTNTIYIPAGCQILGFDFDTVTAFTGGTGSVSVGIAASGTDYAPSTTVTTGGRVTPTYTAANLTAMLATPVNVSSQTANNTGACSTLSITAVAGTGVTAGALVVTVRYIQVQPYTFGNQ